MRQIVFTIVLFASACVTAPRGKGAPLDATAGSRVVRAQELASLSDLPADEALARLRPDLLRPEWRGRAVEIYIDGRPASILMLHELRATDVAEARLLSPEEARLEFGAPASNPILRITLARSGK